MDAEATNLEVHRRGGWRAMSPTERAPIYAYHRRKLVREARMLAALEALTGRG